MAKRITEFTSATSLAETDVLPIVDVSDTTQATSGTTKKSALSLIADYLKARVETLTNKTLTSPKINEDVVLTATSTELNKITGMLDWFYPVGTIYETTSTDLDTTTKMNAHFGGTWEAYGTGRVLVAKSSDTEFDTIGETGGEKTHTLSVAEMPSHTHGSKSLVGKMQFRALTSGTNIADIYSSGNSICSYTGDGGATWGDGINYTSGSKKPTDVITVNATHEHSSVGGNGAHNNLQPYIVVYRYRRTA